jgi:hypothetical protein
LDLVQGRFLGDGNFTASPNLAGDTNDVPEGTKRGALAVVVSGLAGGDFSTASFDRSSPVDFTVLSNDSTSASFSVTLTDDATNPHISSTFVLTLSSETPRQLTLNVSTVALQSFDPSVVSLATMWTPPNAIGLLVGHRLCAFTCC